MRRGSWCGSRRWGRRKAEAEAKGNQDLGIQLALSLVEGRHENLRGPEAILLKDECLIEDLTFLSIDEAMPPAAPLKRCKSDKVKPNRGCLK